MVPAIPSWHDSGIYNPHAIPAVYHEISGGVMTPDKFKAIRKSLVLTQTGMAKYLGGVSTRTVSDWERGINAIPQPVALLMKLYEHSPRLMTIVRGMLKNRPVN